MDTPIIRPAIEELRARIRRLEGAPGRRRTVLPFGIKVIDRHLAGRRIGIGACMRWPVAANGTIHGAAAALFAAGIAARTRGKVLWCLTRTDLFAPALAQAGLMPDRVIYVEAGDEKVRPHLFRGRLAAWWAWRRCRRSRATLHDGLPPPSACCRKLRNHRHRHPPLAAADRGGRFRAANGIRHPLARHRPSGNSFAGTRRWPPPLAARIDPVPCRG